MIFKCRDEYQSRAGIRSALVSILVGLAVLVVLAILVVLVELDAKRLELWASCNESSTCLVGGIFSKVLDEAGKGSAFFANKQDLCAFAHALEVSMRDNQRIRWRIVHGKIKGINHLHFVYP